MTTPTIFALSSGRGPAALAVVRLSGPRAPDAALALTGRPLPPPRTAGLRRLQDPDTAVLLDQAVVLWFPAPASATGEHVIELHIHGGPAVIDAVLAALGRFADLTPAEPGAFTRQAFENGKLDLTAVEGLADLLAAETEAQRTQALGQLSGRLAARVERWRSQLIRALAHVEADLDFGEDEADVPGGLAASVRPGLAALAAEIAATLAEPPRGERVRTGLTVAVAGAPNAGKSSLINALAERDVAIVSAVPGTTRDTIEVRLDLDGYPVTLLDTAGLRETDDPVEAEGVRRACARAAGADLVLWLVAPDDTGTAAAQRILDQDEAPERAVPRETWRIHSKCDLGVPTNDLDGLALSTRTGAGLGALVDRLSRWAAVQLQPGEAPALTRARHRHALAEAHHALELTLHEHDPVLLAELLRMAARAVGRITGRIDVEALLDVIFSDFCIGK